MNRLITIACCLLSLFSFGQTNITSTNPIAEQVLLGNYSASTYTASTVIDNHDAIIQGVNNNVNPDSLKSYILRLATFRNRNTGSDTVSSTVGIGAARRWVFSQFQQISATNDNRLLSSYLQFDQAICNVNQHRNVFAVLPGTDVADNRVIIIEGHMDSRCDDPCDSLCVAEGIEDNASGTALVIELARVMSQFTFKNTIVFMTTIGEEQGLFGANAFADYAVDEGIQIEAVLNNDVIGGIICGQTSSAPSCPGLNDVDSLQVRFFSNGGFNSPHKQLSRFLKLEYQEELLNLVSVPMLLTIMAAEDRVGRGGDHIPFRQNGFPAMRFTSANEHGDASVGVGYTDRQHTSDDILGVDTDNDNVIDSFFVDFNYLARNAVINGVGATMIAVGPSPSDILAVNSVAGNGLEVSISSAINHPAYRVAIRTNSNDWDSVYTVTGIIDTVFPPTPPSGSPFFVSVASVDSLGIESLFSREVLTLVTGINQFQSRDIPFKLLQNIPNPFDEVTKIGVLVNKRITYESAFIMVRDIQGRVVKEIPIDLNNEVNEVNYEHGYGQVGVFSYTLIVDGVEMGTEKMIFAN